MRSSTLISEAKNSLPRLHKNKSRYQLRRREYRKMIQFRPDPSDIPRLKQPFGKLIDGEPSQTMPELKKLVGKNHPKRVTAVGDIVSRETLAANIHVDLRIIDYISMRKPIERFTLSARTNYHVRNPAGVITLEAWDAVKRAMKEEEAAILVEGEEDLLTLPCIAESPDHSMVLYGQPNRGLVAVETTLEARNNAGMILRRMTREETET